MKQHQNPVVTCDICKQEVKQEGYYFWMDLTFNGELGMSPDNNIIQPRQLQVCSYDCLGKYCEKVNALSIKLTA